MTPPPRILAIAGSDSSGGAGIQADIKTITMLGGYAMTAITAVTAQNSTGVTAIEVLSPDMVTAQIDACVSDIGIDAIKIGMLGSSANARAVTKRLAKLDVPIVFDPVMVATSGDRLVGDDTVAAFARLIGLARLTTPNVFELAALGGESGLALKWVSYLAKGGDAEGDMVEDRLVKSDGETITWSAPRIATRHTHGTGCTLSSAIATYLGMGLDLPEAIGKGRLFVRAALEAAPGYGSGHGPMGHHAMREN